MALPKIFRYEDLEDDLLEVGDDIVLAYKSYTWDAAAGAPVKKEDDNLKELPLSKIKEDLWALAFNPSDQPPWNPHLPLPKANLPEPLKHKDLRVQFGFLAIEAPPSKCSVRMHQKKKKGKQKKRDKSKPAVAPNRRRCQPVYLQPRPLHHSPEEIDYFWADSAGKGVSPKLTSLHVFEAPGRVELVQREVVQQRDAKVMRHADEHNRELAAYWLRCRLARAVQARFPSVVVKQRVSNPSGADFEALVRPRLLGELVPEQELERLRVVYEAMSAEMLREIGDRGETYEELDDPVMRFINMISWEAHTNEQ